MSSDSASGRSKGNRFVSAKADTKKMKKAIVQPNTFQASGHCPEVCCATIALSETFPDINSTGIVDMPIAISYEIIWALDRRPPNSAYLLFDDQPARTMPYTPNEEIERIYRKPIGSGAIDMSIRPQRENHGAPNGMTAIVISAGIKDNAGARMNSGLYAAPGYVSSFMMFLRPSASGCPMPPGPTRFGPRRSWIHPAILRSASVSSATPTR